VHTDHQGIHLNAEDFVTKGLDGARESKKLPGEADDTGPETIF
jgi:hypothetical protein